MPTRSLASISTAEITQELNHRRAALLSELSQLDATFSQTRKEPSATASARASKQFKARRTPRKGGRRGPRGDNIMTLARAMVQVIGAGRKSVAEIVAGIAATGYKSKSKNLAAMAAIQLSLRKDLFRRVKRGVYAVRSK